MGRFFQIKMCNRHQTDKIYYRKIVLQGCQFVHHFRVPNFCERFSTHKPDYSNESTQAESDVIRHLTLTTHTHTHATSSRPTLHFASQSPCHRGSQPRQERHLHVKNTSRRSIPVDTLKIRLNPRSPRLASHRPSCHPPIRRRLTRSWNQRPVCRTFGSKSMLIVFVVVLSNHVQR